MCQMLIDSETKFQQFKEKHVRNKWIHQFTISDYHQNVFVFLHLKMFSQFMNVDYSLINPLAVPIRP